MQYTCTQVCVRFSLQWQWKTVFDSSHCWVHCDDVTRCWPRIVILLCTMIQFHIFHSQCIIRVHIAYMYVYVHARTRSLSMAGLAWHARGGAEPILLCLFSPFSDVVLSHDQLAEAPGCLHWELQMADDRDAVQRQAALFSGSTSFVDKFPAELLVRICRFLSLRDRQRLRRVCKTLHQVLDNPLFWKSINIDGFKRSDYVQLHAMFAHRGSTVERLYINGSFDLVGLDLCSCTRLRTLKLEQSPCYVTNMADIVRSLPLLAQLEFQPINAACGLGHCMHVMCRTVEWQDFLTTVQRLDSMTLLSQWDENFVEFLLRQWACQKYRPVSVCMTTMQTQTAQPQGSVQSCYSSLQDLWKECMENFPPCEEPCQFRITWQTSRRLGPSDVPIFELNLDGSPLSLSTALDYTHPDMTDTVSSMHGVISLSNRDWSVDGDECFRSGRFISSPDFVLSETETKFLQFESATAHLTSLSLTEASSLTSSNLETLAHHCRRLTQLNLSGCKKCLNPLFGLAILATNCTQLRILNLQNIPCNYVERTSEMWMCLSQMENLRHLAIDPCLLQASQEADQFTGEQYSVSDEHEIEESLKAMSFIRVLEIQTTLTASKSIQCPHCRNMDGHLIGLVKHMTALNTLLIRGVSRAMCDILLETAIKKCQYLRNLSINMEFSFKLFPLDTKFDSIQKLSIRCPRFNITDMLTSALVEAPLTHVYFAVRYISKGSVTMILQDMPQLVVCHIYCRDGPVMKPPGDVLQFRQSMQEMSNAESRTNPLDFVFNEGRLYDSHTECVTAQSLRQTELVSWWN